MGMSIEKADKTLLEFYHYIKGDVHFCGYNEDNVLITIDFVRNIMRKYQKIEQIMKDIPYGGMATVRRIEEAMEE